MTRLSSEVVAASPALGVNTLIRKAPGQSACRSERREGRRELAFVGYNAIFFGTSGRELLAVRAVAGDKRRVALSIVAIDGVLHSQRISTLDMKKRIARVFLPYRAGAAGNAT
jgi:hypothetical protein